MDTIPKHHPFVNTKFRFFKIFFKAFFAPSFLSVAFRGKVPLGFSPAVW
jgi:hypothetical protein